MSTKRLYKKLSNYQHEVLSSDKPLVTS